MCYQGLEKDLNCHPQIRGNWFGHLGKPRNPQGLSPEQGGVVNTYSRTLTRKALTMMGGKSNSEHVQSNKIGRLTRCRLSSTFRLACNKFNQLVCQHFYSYFNSPVKIDS